jgi:hypothetical protein
MSDSVSPIQPVSRIEPINRVLGIGDMDPSLYQTIAASLVTLFQRSINFDAEGKPLSLALPSILEIFQPRNKYSTNKKYLKKDKKDFQKINSLFKETVE